MGTPLGPKYRPYTYVDPLGLAPTNSSDTEVVSDLTKSPLVDVQAMALPAFAGVACGPAVHEDDMS